MLKIMCDKGTKLFQDVGGLLLEDFRAIARNFDKSNSEKF